MASAKLDLIIGIVDKATGPLGKISGAVGGLGKAALFGGLGAATVAVGGLSAALISGIGDARDAGLVFAQTEAVIKSTGGAAGFTAEQISDMAASYSLAEGKSLFGDDDIQRGQNLLLTFTNITTQLPAATGVMVDMATAMGTDVSGGAIQLGKALNDPINGISALSRVGVTFTEQQKLQIKTMQESGDMAGAQGIILAELNKEFGGSAQAAAAAAGPMVMFKERMGELAESVGAQVLPLLDQFGKWLSSPEIMGAIETGVGAAISFLTGTVFPGLVGAWNLVQPVLSGFATAFGAIATAFQAGGLSAALPVLIEQLGNLGTTITTWIGEQLPIIGAKLLEWGTAFVAWVAPMIPPFLTKLGELATAAWTWITEQVPVVIAKLTEWGTAFVSWIGPMIPPFLGALVNFSLTLYGWLGEQVISIGAKLLEWAGAFVAWIAPMIPPFLTKMGELASAAWGWISEQVPILLGKLGDWGQQFIEFIGPKIPPMLEKLGELGLALVTWVGEQAPPLIAKLVEWGTAFLNFVAKDVLPFIVEKLAALGTAVINWIGEHGPTIITKLIEWGSAFLGFIAKDVLPFIATKLAELGTAVINWIGDEGPKIISKLVEWGAAFLGFIAKDVIPFLFEKLGAITTEIATWITGTAVPWALEELAAVGTAIVDGIEAGISSAWEGFLGWVDEQIAKLPSAVRTALGIGSPSKVFADIGKQIPAGLALGIENNLPAITRAMRNMDTMLQPAIAPIGGGVSVGAHAPQRWAADAPGAAAAGATVYSLTINTSASHEPIVADFNQLAAQRRRG